MECNRILFITITLNKEYLQDREGKIDGGTFIVEGNFKKDWGGTPGGDKIVFGKAEVTIPFEENQVVTKAELSLNKKVKKYNKDDNTITYQVTVKAPSDNTQDVPDVTVQDTFTTNGDKLIAACGESPADLVILDIMMPGIDGLEVCREIRKTSNIPILILSAKAEDMDKIVGFGTGADDYLTKPFHPLELLARVKSQMIKKTFTHSPRNSMLISLKWKNHSPALLNFSKF